MLIACIAITRASAIFTPVFLAVEWALAGPRAFGLLAELLGGLALCKHISVSDSWLQKEEWDASYGEEFGARGHGGSGDKGDAHGEGLEGDDGELHGRVCFEVGSWLK